MGQLATQAQNAQMQTMNPQKNMKSLLERSWPRIAAVITNVRQKGGGQSQGYGAQGGYTQQPQGGYQPSQPPASDPWANGGSAPEF